MVGQSRPVREGSERVYVSKKTTWNYEIPIDQNLGLAEKILEMNSYLSAHSDFLKDIISAGGMVEYFCGIFVNENTVEIFERELIQGCVDIGAKISLCIYPE